MKKRSKSKFPVSKKKIKDFLLNEEGKITKKNIAKIGAILAILGVSMPSDVAAQHTSDFVASHGGSNQGGHHSHNSHGSHGSHGSHNSTAW